MIFQRVTLPIHNNPVSAVACLIPGTLGVYIGIIGHNCSKFCHKTPDNHLNYCDNLPTMSAKPIAKILTTRNSGLTSLLEHAEYLQNLTQALRDSLDPSLAKHVTVANLRDQAAIITTDTPAWLTQLRYQAPLILKTLQQIPGLQSLSKVQLKIQPPSQPPMGKPARHMRLSTGSAQMIESASASTDDAELADALHRLSKNGRPDPQ